MGREEQIINERLRKLEEMQKKGIQPYAYRFEKKNKTSDIQEKYKNLDEDQRTNDFVKTAGRVMIIRDLGNLIFATLQDSFGKIQIVLQNK